MLLLDKNELIKEYVDIATKVIEDRNKKLLEGWYEFCKLHTGKISLKDYKINISKIEF